MRVLFSLHRAVLPALAICMPCIASAAGIRIEITDRDGEPVPNVAISLQRQDESANGSHLAEPAPPQQATINQKDLSFHPHLLIVETGTEVQFPNNDDVRHHVYSFAKAKQFDMTIDSGMTHFEPIRFDSPGIITLGCNIHDDMLAYILVVDTPFFGKTLADGTAELELEPGRYTLNIWTPRMPPRSVPEAIELTVAAGQELEISHQIESRLYPPHQQQESSLEWRDY